MKHRTPTHLFSESRSLAAWTITSTLLACLSIIGCSDNSSNPIDETTNAQALVEMTETNSAPETAPEREPAHTEPAPPEQAPAEPEPSSPSISFEEPVFDFGKVDGGDIVRHSFAFVNRGGSPLIVSDVLSSCGCTTAELPPGPVAPGESGSLTVDFDTSKFSGAVEKAVTVRSNDPENPETLLRIKGEIWQPVEVTPNIVLFDLGDGSETGQFKEVKILNHLSEPMNPSAPKISSDKFTATLSPVQPGKEYQLRVSPKGSFRLPSTEADIEIETGLEDPPKVLVKAVAKVKQPILLLPSAIRIPPGGEPGQTHSVTILNQEQTPLKLSNPRINLSGASLELREMHPGKLFKLSLTLPSGIQISAEDNVAIEIESNHAKHSLLRIPVQSGASK